MLGRFRCLHTAQARVAALVVCRPNTLAMPTLTVPTYNMRPLTPKRYAESPLRFVMLQSEVPPYEQHPLAGSSLHPLRTRRKTSAVSFRDALHAAMGGSQPPLERLPRVAEQVSPNGNTREACPSDETHMLSVTHTSTPQELPEKQLQKNLA